MEAKKYHSKKWNTVYTENDFYTLSSFQPGITGRVNPSSTGGAGLAHVLDFLEVFSDNYRCYCLSGNSIFNLDKKFIKKDNEGWYTFSDVNNSDFSNTIPSCGCISKTKLYYPGTAFFLHLEINGGNNESTKLNN